MTGRPVIVSNRIPTDDVPAGGGLIVALHDCLLETGGLWVGSAGDPVAVPSQALTQIGAKPYRRMVFDITPEEREEFYLGYCNAVLWPLFHRRSDLPALPQWQDFMDWIAALREVFRIDPATETLLNGRLRRNRAEFSVASFPVGINAKEFSETAISAERDTELAPAPDQKLLIGVDRLDYSKGLVQRFEAFEAYLDARAPDAPRASFLQIAPLSRSDLNAYRDIREALETTAGRINGRHSELDWTPIRYLSRNVPRDQVAGLLRRADVGLVTPLADGTNLVAKEFVAAQDPEDPGVLILSHFAGAAEQMTAALRVNPYDTAEMADAIQTALTMPLDARRARHAELLEGVQAQDVTWWTRSFLERLDQAIKPKRQIVQHEVTT